MNRYEIVTAGNLIELSIKVNDKKKRGFIPTGGVTIDASSRCFKYIQAVYRPREHRTVYMHNGKEIPFSEYMKQTIKEALNEESKA